ncbi:MAG: triphosphoribosyl-dephospho-CoA synthase [Pirellulaceae bacterium]
MATLPLPHPFDRPWPIADAVAMACLLEASAEKAGNVHPRASFGDMSFSHFVASSLALKSTLDGHSLQSLGTTIRECTAASRQAAGVNTNLGTILLIIPLAFSVQTLRNDRVECRAHTLQETLHDLLNKLTPVDCQEVYEAIRIAQPGGLGDQAENDVQGTEQPESLVDAMRQVADVDAVARQYTTDFSDVLNVLLPWLEEDLQAGWPVDQAVCRLQIRWLAREPDGLITRKLGREKSSDVRDQAAQLWNAESEITGTSTGSDRKRRFSESQAYQTFDRNLRDPEHRFNPGTTADLIAATLFVRLVLDQPTP